METLQHMVKVNVCTWIINQYMFGASFCSNLTKEVCAWLAVQQSAAKSAPTCKM